MQQTSTGPPPETSVTFLANNTFLVSTPQTTLLIDPWLTSDLVFFTPLFFRGSKPATGLRAVAKVDLSAIDAVLLTQGLPDHAHPPSLRLLDREKPIYAPNKASKLLHELEFRNVHFMEAGDCRELQHGVKLTAAKGSLVGPPWSEPQLAYIIEFTTPEKAVSRIYHEPHGNHDDSVLEQLRGKLDAVLAPVVSTKIPLLGNYPLVNGVEEAVGLCKKVIPRKCVTFDNSGGEASGILPRFLQSNGGEDVFHQEIAKLEALKDMEIVTAKAGEKILVAGGT